MFIISKTRNPFSDLPEQKQKIGSIKDDIPKHMKTATFYTMNYRKSTMLVKILKQE